MADYVNVDFTVTWNKDMTGATTYPASSFTDGSAVDTILCDIQRTKKSNIPSGINYQENGSSESMETWSGFGRQNLALFNGLALGNLDAVILEGETMDKCLSHAAPNSNAQHAHSLSPCIKGSNFPSAVTGSTTKKPGACNDGVTDCLQTGQQMAFSRQNWSAGDGAHGGPYGLAKDGHVIYGPYDASGELWSCDDVDYCNGFFHADGSYGYASTSFFPYMVGCWGPAYASMTIMPSCTSNGCGVAQTSGSMTGQAFSAIALLAISANSFL